MRRQGLRPTLSIKQSLPTTPRDRKKRGISLSNQKMKSNQPNKENLQHFVSQKKLSEDKRVGIEKFIIFNMDRDQWESSRRGSLRSNVRTTSQHVINPSTIKIQSQFRVIKQFTNNVQFPPTKEFILQNLPVMQIQQAPKARNRGRARDIKSRINEIQQRLNNLLQATKIN